MMCSNISSVMGSSGMTEPPPRPAQKSFVPAARRFSFAGTSSSSSLKHWVCAVAGLGPRGAAWCSSPARTTAMVIRSWCNHWRSRRSLCGASVFCRLRSCHHEVPRTTTQVQGQHMSGNFFLKALGCFGLHWFQCFYHDLEGSRINVVS